MAEELWTVDCLELMVECAVLPPPGVELLPGEVVVALLDTAMLPVRADVDAPLADVVDLEPLLELIPGVVVPPPPQPASEAAAQSAATFAGPIEPRRGDTRCHANVVSDGVTGAVAGCVTRLPGRASMRPESITFAREGGARITLADGRAALGATVRPIQLLSCAVAASAACALGNSAPRPAEAPTAASEPEEARCRAGHPAPGDCFAAGSAYDRGTHGHPLRQDTAITLFTLGCRANVDDPSCAALKNEIVSLQLSAPRRGEALALLQSMCDAGVTDLCNDLASALIDGVGTRAQPDKGLELYERTCAIEAGPSSRANLAAVVAACEEVAELLRGGRTAVATEEARGRALAAEARAVELSRRMK